MRGLFLNLPSSSRIVRRYNCTYNSPTFLLHPVELISLAGVFRHWHQGDPYLIDSVAEQLSLSDLIKRINDIQPDFMVCIAAVEYFDEDINMLNHLKTIFPNVKQILFGHYATEFYREIMAASQIDYILHGEPEMIFSELMHHLVHNTALSDTKGISYRKNGEVIHQPGARRITDPNLLPLPAYDLLHISHYQEPFFPRPYGIILSARGCPYTCNYCVKTYGTKLTALTPENMIRHLERQVELFHIRSFRFIDDTFTILPERVIHFCSLMLEKGYQHIQWSCFSRADTLHPEMLRYMKKAGCRRIYIGMESGSQRLLDYYDKRLDLKEARENIIRCHQHGFETVGMFMVGSPEETFDDVKASLRFAKEVKFTYISIFQFKAYPGTAIFGKLRDMIDFSILPYRNEFKNPLMAKKAIDHQKYFFRRYYFRLPAMWNVMRNMFHNSWSELLALVRTFVIFLVIGNENKVRKDYI